MPTKPPSIAFVRKAIDDADDILLKALAARFRAVAYIAELKRAQDLPAEDPDREHVLKERWKTKAKTLKIPEDLALLMLDLILAASKRYQQQS